jgi:hypothetical protein
MEQHVASLGASLARLGVPASAAPMLEAVARVEGRSIDRGRGTAAWLLSLLGTGLPSIVQGLRWALTQQHPQFAPGQVWALGRLGRGGSAVEQRRLVELVRQVVAAADSDSSATITLAGQAALSDLGEPVDLPGAAAHALERCDRYSWSSCLELLLLALELVGSRDDLPVSLALPFLGDEEPRLHRAARRALGSRGAAVPSFEILDAATLAELPVPELEARLARPFAPRETLGLQLAASPSPALTPWLLAQWPRLPAPRHREDPRSDARSAWLRALAASHEPEALALTRQVVTDEPGLLALEHWPEELADLVARQFLHGANPRQREGARDVAVLDDLGLAPEDFTRRHR